MACAVNTVRRQLAEGDTPKYVHKDKRITKLEAYEAYLRTRQESAKPLWIPATVLLRELMKTDQDEEGTDEIEELAEEETAEA